MQTNTKNAHICIVAHELVGITPNAGIGTFNSTLANLLSNAGFKVTVLFSGIHWPTFVDENKNPFKNTEIQFGVLPTSKFSNTHYNKNIIASTALYESLKSEEFDIIFLPDNSGIGFHTLQAHSLSHFLPHTKCIVVCHGSTEWCEIQSNRTLDTIDKKISSFLERSCIENADILVGPNAYILNWYASNQYQMSLKQTVIPLPIFPPIKKKEVTHFNYTNLCFFGRLEIRKGIDIFCDAIDILHEKGRHPTHLYFLGRSSAVFDLNSLEYIEMRSANWKSNIHIHTEFDRDDCIDFLLSLNALVIIPSRNDNSPYCVHECIAHNIPFIAAQSGGIPEIVKNHELLFTLDPNDLVSKIENFDVTKSSSFVQGNENNFESWIELCNNNIGASKRHIRSASNSYKKHKNSSICIVQKFDSKKLESNSQMYSRDTNIQIVYTKDIPHALQHIQSTYVYCNLYNVLLNLDYLKSIETHNDPDILIGSLSLPNSVYTGKKCTLAPHLERVHPIFCIYKAEYIRKKINKGHSTLEEYHSDIFKDNIKILYLTEDIASIEIENLSQIDSCYDDKYSEQNFHLYNQDLFLYHKTQNSSACCQLLIQKNNLHLLSSHTGTSRITGNILQNIEPPFLFEGPRLEPIPKEIITCRIRFARSENSFVRIFYKRGKDEHFSIHNSITKRSFEGLNEIYFALDAHFIDNRFLIEFGNENSRAIEIEDITIAWK